MPICRRHRQPDYTLFVDAKAIGTVEAKPEGHSLTGVEEAIIQTVSDFPSELPAWRQLPRLLDELNGVLAA